MRASWNRKKLTAGCLTLVSIAWSVDMITGAASPRAAQATALADAGGLPRLPGDPPDRADLERFLFSDAAPPASPAFEALTRDPFASSAEFHALLSPPISTPAVPEEPPAASPSSAPAPPVRFADRHRLDGVVAGRTPLALVDGRMLRIGAELDGYRLITIERDRIVVERDGRKETLSIPPPQFP